MDSDRFRKVLCECRGKLSQGDLSTMTKTADNPVPVSPMTISAIERGATRDPGLLTVVRLVEAMGMTLSSFFARIEDLPGPGATDHDHTPPPAPVSPADETVPTLTLEELNTIRALTKAIRIEDDRDAQSERRPYRRPAANPRRPKAPPSAQAGSDRPGVARRRRVKKKTKRPR